LAGSDRWHLTDDSADAVVCELLVGFRGMAELAR
jgi:hypothetical protein